MTRSRCWGRYFNQMTKQLKGQREPARQHAAQIGNGRRRLLIRWLSFGHFGCVGSGPCKGGFAFVNRVRPHGGWELERGQQSVSRFCRGACIRGRLFNTVVTGQNEGFAQARSKVSRQGQMENLCWSGRRPPSQ